VYGDQLLGVSHKDAKARGDGEKGFEADADCCCYLDSHFCRTAKPGAKKLVFEGQSPEEVPNRIHGKSKGSWAELSCK